MWRLAALLVLLAPPAAAQRPADPLDLYLLAGQSNARGSGGDLAEAPVPPHLTAYWAYLRDDGTRSLAVAPVDRESPLSQSLGPAFAARYWERTGRRVLLVQLAVSGSANVPAADRGFGHWSAHHDGPGAEGGPNRLRTGLEDLDRILDQFPNRDQLRPGGIIWVQGETDATKIDQGYPIGDAYLEELRATATRLRVALAERLPGEGFPPLYLVQTGHRAAGDTPGFELVRELQWDGAELGAYTLACDDAHTFPELGWLADNVHWDQDALNHVGEHVADVAAGDHPPRETAGEDGPERRAPRPYPNPARPGQRVRGLEAGALVVDLLGRHVATADARGGLEAPPVPGVYLAGRTRLVVW